MPAACTAPAAVDRSLARRALSSKPAGRRCCCRSMGQTDGRTDARPLHRPCCAGSANNNRKSSTKYGEVLTSSTPLLCPVFACCTRMPNIHVHAVQFITPTTIGERSIVMSVSVRLSVCVYLNIFSLVNYFCKTVTN